MFVINFEGRAAEAEEEPLTIDATSRPAGALPEPVVDEESDEEEDGRRYD